MLYISHLFLQKAKLVLILETFDAFFHFVRIRFSLKREFKI